MDDEAPPPEQEVSDQPDKPKLRVVRPLRPKGHKGPVTAEVYEAAAQVYLNAKRRSARELARLTGLSDETCIKMITTGYPYRGWASLRERAELHDRQLQAASTTELSASQLLDATRFLAIRNENLNVARQFRALGFMLAKRISAAVDRATADRVGVEMREVDVEIGTGKNKRTVKRAVKVNVNHPPSLTALATAANAVGSLVFAAGESEKTWARVEAPDDAPPGIGWDELSDEQYKYIIENDGRLPPGVSIEQLRHVRAPSTK